MKIPRPTTPTDRRPYRIKGPARILIVSDVHVPFHDPGAIEASIDFAQSQGEISHVLVNGDLLDAYHLSTFEKDPKVRRLSEEIDQAIQIHGATGVSQWSPLSEMYMQQRTLRLADGPDEVYHNVVARNEVNRYNQTGA